MSYTDSKTDWDEDYANTPEEMNRIEGNIEALKSEGIDIDGNKTFTGNNTHSGDAEFTGGFIADGVTTTGEGTNLLYLSVGASGTYTSPTTTLTKIYTVTGTWAGSSTPVIKIQALVDGVYTDVSLIESVYNSFATLGPGEYRMYLVAGGAGTAKINAVAVFGDNSI